MVQVEVRRAPVLAAPRDTRSVVGLVALAAVLLRLPGLTRPIRADEAGFTLVARAWHPGPGGLYGPYFVDRPPLLIAVFRLSDALGGPLFIRVLGALACGALVLVAAGLARDLAGDRAARWCAVAVAAVTGNIFVDAVAVKGELLALPVLVGAMWLAVRAVRAPHHALLLAAGAGLLGSTAVGLKQNLVGALVFAGVLSAGSWLAGRVPARRGTALLTGLALGAAVPVLATVGWAVAAGVPLHTLWYDVFGFRSAAADRIASSESGVVTRRAGMLVLSGVLCALLPILGLWLARIADLWRRDGVLTTATLAMLALDAFGLVAGGSFWRDYLFPLVPTAVVAVATTAGRPAMRAWVRFAAVSTVLALVGWTVYNIAGVQEYDETDTGHALARVAAPGDTLVVFGGRADLQLTSGMSSPYEHLWSLPMRTLDPDLTELDAVVTGPDAPTWIVEWVPFGTWGQAAGARLDALVEAGYTPHGTGCGGRPVWLHRGVTRPALTLECH